LLNADADFLGREATSFTCRDRYVKKHSTQNFAYGYGTAGAAKTFCVV